MKRFLAQYEYLTMELEETQYMFDEYNKRFLEECYGKALEANKAAENSKEENTSKGNENTSKENASKGNENNKNSTSEADSAEKNNKNNASEAESSGKAEVEVEERVKRLYKRLSLRTHPDKGGDREMFEKLIVAYNTLDIIGMIRLAIILNVDYSEFTSEASELFERSISEMSGKIEHFKRTLAWNWGSASEEQKAALKQRFKLK
jgi:hypothetical protein